MAAIRSRSDDLRRRGKGDHRYDRDIESWSVENADDERNAVLVVLFSDGTYDRKKLGL